MIFFLYLNEFSSTEYRVIHDISCTCCHAQIANYYYMQTVTVVVMIQPPPLPTIWFEPSLQINSLEAGSQMQGSKSTERPLKVYDHLKCSRMWTKTQVHEPLQVSNVILQPNRMHAQILMHGPWCWTGPRHSSDMWAAVQCLKFSCVACTCVTSRKLQVSAAVVVV